MFNLLYIGRFQSIDSTRAFRRKSNPLHLICLQFDRCFATKHRNKNFDLAIFLVNLTNLPFKILERAINNNDRISLGKIDRMTHDITRNTLEYFLNLFRQKRHRLIGSTHKTSNLRRIAHHAPCIITRDHVNQYVSRECFLAHFCFASIFYFYLCLRRDDHVEDMFFHSERLYALSKVARHRIFVSRIGVDCIPLSFTAVCLFCHSF